jgi:hypothetical protein
MKMILTVKSLVFGWDCYYFVFFVVEEYVSSLVEQFMRDRIYVFECVRGLE